MMARMASIRSDRLHAVVELQNAIAAANLVADDVMALVVERVVAMMGATHAAIALVEGHEMVFRMVSRPAPLENGARQPRDGSLQGACANERAPLRVDDVSADRRVDPTTRARVPDGSIVCVPLLYGESAVGTVEVAAAARKHFTDEDTETLRLLAQIVAIALHRAYTYPRPRLDNTTDPLTGLGNKRAYDERIIAELTRNARYGHSFSLAVIDLDGVEAAIDRHGQVEGDAALRQVASILRSNTRVIDGAFRVAADDFALVMPGTSVEGARVVAERCRAHILDARLLGGAVVVKCGIVQAANETVEELAGRVVAAVAADRS
jgi:diguanylate cyclase (GGDEF)-like protein